MNKKIRDKEYRIILILTNVELNCSAILSAYNTVNSKRHSHVLILLDTAVVVGIKICQTTVLIERVLLYIKSWRINVRSKDVHSCFHGI